MTLLRALVALCIATALMAAPAAAAPGDLDSGFASGGIFTGSFMTTFAVETSYKVAIDSQGRVVVAATLEGQLNGGLPRKVNVLRLTPQGSPDASFGTGGQLTLPIAGDTYLGGLVVDAQDRPIVASTSGQVPNGQIALMRLTTAGQPDTSFSGDGQVVAGLPGAPFYGPQVSGLAIDSTGGLLVAGTAFAAPVPFFRQFFVSRFTSGGDQDTSYGNNGGWRDIGTAGPGARELTAIRAVPGGGAVVAGYDADIFVTRLTSAGAPDNGFDGDGTAHTDFGKAGPDVVTSYGLNVDDQGRPIVVGQLTVSGNGRWAIARMTSGGAMDGSFGSGTPAAGVVLGPATGARLDDVELQRDGKLVFTGIASRADLSGNTLPVARYTSAGALDTTFAPGAATPGIATVDAGSYNLGSDLALSPGAITAVGFRRASDTLGIRDLPIVVRLTAEAAAAPPAVAPAVTPPATAAPTPAAAAAVLPKFASLVTLPATKQCVSRRKFSIRLRVPKGSAVTSAEVKVNGKRAAVRRGARLRSVVNLTQLPKGRFRVDIVMRLADGRTVKGTRSYRTCAVKRRGGSGPKV